ncbi:hypothetical protein QUB70_31330 [Microcoleus sp. A003_D6]
MPIPQEKKICGMGILPVLVIFARGLLFISNPVTTELYPSASGTLALHSEKYDSDAKGNDIMSGKITVISLR